jgi:hypothetical protein
MAFALSLLKSFYGAPMNQLFAIIVLIFSSQSFAVTPPPHLNVIDQATFDSCPRPPSAIGFTFSKEEQKLMKMGLVRSYRTDAEIKHLNSLLNSIEGKIRQKLPSDEQVAAPELKGRQGLESFDLTYSNNGTFAESFILKVGARAIDAEGWSQTLARARHQNYNLSVCEGWNCNIGSFSAFSDMREAFLNDLKLVETAAKQHDAQSDVKTLLYRRQHAAMLLLYFYYCGDEGFGTTDPQCKTSAKYSEASDYFNNFNGRLQKELSSSACLLVDSFELGEIRYKVQNILAFVANLRSMLE